MSVGGEGSVGQVGLEREGESADSEKRGNPGPTNILKVRDDVRPSEFVRREDDQFESKEGLAPFRDSDRFATADLRRYIEPWLTSLFQSDHLTALIGSGLTTAIEVAAGANKNDAMQSARFTTHGERIKEVSDESACKAGRSSPNLEDEIRTASQLLRGLQILGDSTAAALEGEIDSTLKKFADSILGGERALLVVRDEARTQAFTMLVSFLMSFASRTGSRDRLGIFTTNYDRLIEMGAELAGLHLLDRFVGTISPVFRSSRLDLDLHYNPPGIRGEPRFVEGVARFTKLHGSLDWVSIGADIRRIGLPFGAKEIQPYLEEPGLSGASANSLMIYPNAAKDRETAEYPYVELFRDFAAAVVRPNSTIVTYGYSFGDEHINRVLRDALTIPSAHLVVISYSDPLGRIRKMYEEWGRSSQISLLVGPDLADIESLTTHYLPKPSIDLASRRMGDLLRQRYEAPSVETTGSDNPSSANRGGTQ